MTGMLISHITRSNAVYTTMLYPSNPFRAVYILIIFIFFNCSAIIYDMNGSSLIIRTDISFAISKFNPF